jgi:hypothetical protein
MKKPYTPHPHLVERAKAIRRKRAEQKLGRPMTEEEWQHQLRKGKASKWARGGKR